MSLTKVNGIGKKVAEGITEATGIATLEALAAASGEQVQVIADAVPGGPEKVASWVEQAKGLVEVETVDTQEEQVVEEAPVEVAEVEEEVVQAGVNPVEEPAVAETTDLDNEANNDAGDDNVSDDELLSGDMSIDDWLENHGNKLIEQGHSRSGLLTRAAAAMGYHKHKALLKLDMNISAADNLRKIFK